MKLNPIYTPILDDSKISNVVKTDFKDIVEYKAHQSIVDSLNPNSAKVNVANTTTHYNNQKIHNHYVQEYSSKETNCDIKSENIFKSFGISIFMMQMIEKFFDKDDQDDKL